MKPKPTSDGIVMATHSDRALFAYWALRGDGTFYLLKSLFEETKGQRQTLFFDTRVLRVTEVCMYLSRLYSRMGIPNESRLYLQLRFGGLKGALLKATDSRPFFHEQGPSAEDAVSTQVTTTLDALRENMPEVVKELTRPLFVLFDYYKLEDDNYRGIVENYQNGRIW
jgi:hypothetical protein